MRRHTPAWNLASLYFFRVGLSYQCSRLVEILTTHRITDHGKPKTWRMKRKTTHSSFPRHHSSATTQYLQLLHLVPTKNKQSSILVIRKSQFIGVPISVFFFFYVDRLFNSKRSRRIFSFFNYSYPTTHDDNEPSRRINEYSKQCCRLPTYGRW